jgi:replicative DNA helicase
VFVDYLQLMHASGENRTQEITQISGRLKALAKDLNVPVVVLSQLTRDNAKGGAASRPQLHHLRDGGSIEQDADVVLMIHRPNKATDHGRFTDGEEVELILAKQRNGPANVNSKVHWHGPTMRFTDITTSHEEGAA